MRICLCAPEASTYSETFIREHIRRLPADLVFYGTPPETITDGSPVVPFALQVLARRAARRGWRRVASEADRRIERRIAAVLKRSGADVVLAEYGPTAVSFLPACRAAGVPLVVHFHGYDLYRTEVLEEYGKRYQELFHEAAAAVVVSSAMKRRLEEMAGPGLRTFQIPCGANCDMFTAAAAASNPPTFVTVGRFVDKKAPHLALLAFQRTVAECPESRLVMAGEGPLLAACQELARALGVERQVRFAGRLDPPQVAELFRGARAFVQHSVTAPSGDSEGTPVAVMEAGAAALPAIGTRHAGIPDVVLDGETGLLADEFDIEGMARHMIRLANDPELAGRLGRAARQRVTSCFSSERMAGELREVLAWAAARR